MKDFILFYSKTFILEKEWKQEQEERDKQTPCWAGNLMQGSIPGPWPCDLGHNQESDT